MAWETTPTTVSGGNTLKKVAICIPHTGWLHTEFNERTYIPLRVFPVTFCNKIPISSKAYSVTVARNSLIDEALKLECDYALWVDTDTIIESVGKKEIEEKLPDGTTTKTMVPFETNDPNVALKTLFDIMEQHPDINLLSGLYRAKKKEGFTYAAWLRVQENPTGYKPIGEFSGNFFEVDTVGMGFCLERLAPLKNVKKPLFVWDHQDEPSEDFMHCELLKKVTGKKVHIFSDVRITHGGDLFLKSNGDVRTRQA